MIKIPESVTVDINLIKEDPGNPNVMKKDKLDALKKNIKKFGFLIPVITNKDYLIADGFHRYSAAKELGMLTVPVIKLDVTEVDRRMLRQVLNKLHGEHREDLDIEEYKFLFENDAQSEFAELMALNEREERKLFDQFIENKEEDDELVSVTAYERAKETTKVKLGDIYQLGDHRLMCGDSTSEQDVNKLMNGEKADMLFTDPPYGVSYNKKNEFLNNLDNGARVQEEIQGDNNIEEIKNIWLNSFKNIKKNLAEYNSYYITGPQGGGLHLMMMMMIEAGLTLRHVLVWIKNNHVLGRTDYNYKHEHILYGWVNKHNFYGSGSQNKSVWNFDKPHQSELHPTMKPVELIENAILNSTKPENIVLDLFGGSGSTLIAAEKTGRICYIMEIDPVYVQIILDRWSKYTGKEWVKL